MKSKTKNGAGKNVKGYARIQTATSVSTFMSRVQRASRSDGFYAFRGQEDSLWNIESAASRRWQKCESAPPTPEQFARYHKDNLISPAKLRGYHRQGGRMWTDLELLANLQHHRAATGLIDFTRNPLIALWFACHKRPETNGGVFMANLHDDSKYKRVATDAIESDVGELFRRADASLQYWDLEEMTPRIAHQAGVFVFGRPSVPPDAIVLKVEIPREVKRPILAELETTHNISERHLFGDFHGFAKLNRVDAPIREA